MAESTVLVIDDEPRIVDFLAENPPLSLQPGSRRISGGRDHTRTSSCAVVVKQDVAIHVPRHRRLRVAEVSGDLSNGHAALHLHARPSVP